MASSLINSNSKKQCQNCISNELFFYCLKTLVRALQSIREVHSSFRRLHLIDCKHFATFLLEVDRNFALMIRITIAMQESFLLSSVYSVLRSCARVALLLKMQAYFLDE